MNHYGKDHIRFALLMVGTLLALLMLVALPASAQDTVKVRGIGRADTTCFVLAGNGGVTGATCPAPPVVVPPDTTPAPPDTTSPPPTDSFSVAYNRWVPSYPGECTAAQHNAYRTKGPDGKWYPTWHPPVDPSGCFYGHEHGDNPALSPLGAEPIPFGYVNEQAIGGANYHRHEDHVGHKVFVANGAEFRATSAAEAKAPIGLVTCDVLAKLHQGTHSPDAFTNNLHEQMTRVRCDNGWAFEVQLLSAIGAAGTVMARCPDHQVPTGAYVPDDSPTSAPQNPGRSMGHRFIASPECVEVPRPSVFENWKTQNPIIGPDGRHAVRFAWYWSVSDPSRYWSPDGMKRTLDQCFRQVDGEFQTINNPCLTLRRGWDGVPIPWDDERSIFKGANRGLRLNDFQMTNESGAEVFYTDVLGLSGSLTPFPGSVRQYVKNGHYPYPLGGGGNSVSGDFNAPGVRAVN